MTGNETAVEGEQVDKSAQRGNDIDGNGTRPPSRRRILQALGSAGLVGIAGCTSGDDEPTATDASGGTDGSDGGATSTPGEARQNSVTINLGYKITVTADFWLKLYGIMPYFTNVLEPLTWVSQDLRPKPWLATEWERTGDRTWEFTLRDGVQFHNGEDLTAEAVRFSIKEMFDGFGNAKPFLQLEGPESVRVVDEQTVEFTTIRPFTTYPAHIAHNMVAVQHPDADSEDAKPIGTGPFQAVEIKPEQHAKVRKFDDYWHDEEPNVSEITYRVIEDANTRFLALQNHEIDVAYNIPRGKVSSLREADWADVETQLEPSVAFAPTNIYKPPTDDVKLRRALNYAVSQEQLVETVLENVGQPARGPISPLIYWSAHDDLPAYGPDRTEAERLVDESTYDGEELRMIVSSGEPEAGTIAEVLQQWFSEIGVKTNVEVMEYSTYWDQWSSGQAHLTVASPGTLSASADYIIYGLFHSEGQWNHTVYNDQGTGVMSPGEEVNQLIEAGRATRDGAVTEEKYGQVQQIVMDQGIIIPLYYVEYVFATYEDVSGVDLHPVRQMQRWASLKHHEQ